MPPKVGGIVGGCPNRTDGSIDLEQVCQSIDEIIAWLQDIQKICHSLSPVLRSTQVDLPEESA